MPLPLHLRYVRTLLRKLNYHLSPALDPGREPFDPQLLRAAEDALRQLPTPDEPSRRYLDKHIPRLARTLALVPPPAATGRVLELGCYLQITPFLERLCGYREVRGAYYGPPGRTDRKRIDFPDGAFECGVDLFDAERDRFPYEDASFDLVIAGEVIEHMLHDPMHTLLESRRVLAEGGRLLITTPNVGSITSVAKTLDGHDNPQIFFLYKRPGEEPEVGHMREYTAYELGEFVKAAGFEVESLFTTFIAEFETHRPLLALLRDNGYDTEHRGEQSWCVAVKREALAVDRYPWFVYSE
jgi:SAM-dependent methyltransferase